MVKIGEVCLWRQSSFIVLFTENVAGVKELADPSLRRGKKTTCPRSSQ